MKKASEQIKELQDEVARLRTLNEIYLTRNVEIRADVSHWNKRANALLAALEESEREIREIKSLTAHIEMERHFQAKSAGAPTGSGSAQ